MTIADIRNILESPYNRKIWKSFLQTQFTNNKLNAEDRGISLSDKTLSKQCLSLGIYEINEYTNIGIFEVELNEKVNITRNRVALRNLIKDITQQVAGAMVVFVQGDKWRFSYISKRKVKNTNNEIESKETAPKRYTYLFGKNEKALTASIRFDKLIQKQKTNLFDNLSLDDFEEAFSVEKLSKEFFKNYKDTYEDFVQFLTGKRYAKKGNKYVEQVMHEPNWQLTSLFNKDEKQARDFCKRMMGRIVFLYFIQKKGWLSVAKGKNWGEGNPDYLFDLFRKSKHQADFYHQELVPLFFKTLNNPDSENAKHAFRFPYLNGGLFDDSQDKKYNKLHLPETVFKSLFETFNNFNFTIYEDAPDEHTVAVDPEMLGHIFENLLEDNKDKGAFYTPKEIVHYMCQESLKAFLSEKLKVNNERLDDEQLASVTIDKIIQQAELNAAEKSFAEKNAYKIIDALEKVKICDPAIGSGAFPMGLLQEIFNAQIYLQELKGFKKDVSDADIKKHIIEESIYGVDIDAGAVDIARLRFWLSLVVDETVPQPLPNLDFKIVCANTLIPTGYDKFVELAEKTQTPTLLRMDGEIQKLQSIRDKYFDEAGKGEKENLKIEFIQTRDSILAEFQSLKKSYALGDFLEKISEWQPFEEKSCSWFDAWWMFGIKDGFDIVIGNPPYGVPFTDAQKTVFKKHYTTTNTSKQLKGSLDSYTIFIEKGFNLLRKNGNLHYIVPISITSSDSVSSLHNLLEKNCIKIQVSSYAVRPQPVFENAVVNTSILFFTKTNSSNEKLLSTKMYRKNKDFSLQHLVDNLEFIDVSKTKLIGRYPKISLQVEDAILRKLHSIKIKIRNVIQPNGIPIYYRTTGGRYFKVITNSSTGSTKEKPIHFDPKYANTIGAILSSNLFFWWYQIFSNNLDLKSYEIEEFPFPKDNISEKLIEVIESVYSEYLIDIEKNSNVRETKKYANIDSFKEYRIGKSKHIIDRIDQLICPLFGLSQTEIEFIKNYEIEFRITDEN